MVPQHVGERPPRTASQQRILEPDLQRDHGMPGVHHADEHATRTQHSARLCHDGFRMLAVMDDAPRIDHVEPGVPERQRLGIEALQRRVEAV